MSGLEELNQEKSEYEKSRDWLLSELSQVIVWLNELSRELAKSPKWIDQKLNRLETRIKEIENELLNIFLKNISSKYYEKISYESNQEEWLTDWKIVYSWQIDFVWKSKTITIIQASDIPDKFKKNIQQIQESINFLKWLQEFDKRNYHMTIRILEDVKNPIFLNDYYYNQALWLSYLHTKQHDIALSFFEKTKTSNKGEQYALLMNKAAVLRELWRFDEAKTTYDEVLAKNPWDSTWLFALGILHRVIWHKLFNEKKYEEAWKTYAEWSKSLFKSDNIQARQYFYKSYLNIWVSQYKLWKLKEAEETFREIAEDENKTRFLSKKDIETLIWWLYHSSNWNEKSTSLAMDLAKKHWFEWYAKIIQMEQDWKAEYKWEYTISNDPIIIKYKF